MNNSISKRLLVFIGAGKGKISQIDPHLFVGFTGGAKGAVIGCGAAALMCASQSG